MSEVEKVQCPHCKTPNAIGSNICEHCLHDIRKVANPQWEDDIATVFAPPPKPGLWRRFKRWLARRKK